MVFTYPWFLLGLLTTVIPVVIHLFELRTPKRIMFTNVEFIREVKLVTARQRKLKHLLVLFTRIFFLVFLVFAFTQPYLPALIDTVDPQSNIGVIIDCTPSMQATANGEQQVFERATREARGLTTVYPASTNFIIANESNQKLSSIIYPLTIDKLKISGQAGNLNAGISRTDGLHGQISQLFVFSDFQKNSFSVRTLDKIDSSQQVFLVPVGAQNTSNIFVDSVWVDDAFVRSNTDVILRIRLRNSGNNLIDNCQVKVFVGARQAAVLRVALPPNKLLNTSVRVQLAGAQLAQCKIELEDYPVTFDNDYYFTLQPSPRIKVLDVVGANREIATQGLYANEPLFSYNTTQAVGLNYQELDAANLVLVQAQAQISVGLREGLRRVTQRGGSVVIVPTAGTTGRTTYDQLFRELSVGPVQWEATGAAPVLRDVEAPSLQNPFFKDVFGVQNRPPVMPKASPVLHWSRSGAEIMRMRDGDEFLAAFPSGKGTVYLFAAPFDKAYSDFTQHALFVPVMYRLAMQSYQREQQPAYRLNQGTLAVDVTDAIAAVGNEQVFKLVKDSLTFIPNQRLQAGILRFDVPPDMREPGFYKLMHSGKTVVTIAFNFDKRESELATYSAEELRQLVGPNRPNIQVYDAAAGESVAAKYKAERVGRPLWQYFLWAALACLLAEVLLLRFLRQSKAVETVGMAA
jgi:hypothetical protein